MDIFNNSCSASAFSDFSSGSRFLNGGGGTERKLWKRALRNRRKAALEAVPPVSHFKSIFVAPVGQPGFFCNVLEFLQPISRSGRTACSDFLRRGLWENFILKAERAFCICI